MRKNIVWTLFVLDFDETYSHEADDAHGVTPLVYLIPVDKIVEVQQCAYDAKKKFVDDYSLCIGDRFEDFMEELEIPFNPVGSIDLTFGERQVDYLADYIPKAIV